MSEPNKTDILRIVYTVLIFFNNLAYGISLNIIGAVLVDLSFLYGTTIETISSINFTFSIGYMIGSLVSFLTRWINRQLLLSFLVMMQALTLMFLPFYKHYWLAFVMMVMSNVGAGGWDSATSLWLVELWPTKNSAILQANQFMYGAGSILAPLLAAPFLHGIKSEVLVGNETRLLTVENRIMSLSIPFGVNGLLQGIVPVIFFLMYFAFPYKASEEGNCDKDSINLRKPPTEQIPHRNTKLVLMGLCLGTFLAAEMGFQIFSPSMLQYLPIKMTASTAAHALSIMSATFTIGRLATAFISLKVSIDVILAYHFVIQLISVGIFYINANNLTMIYIGMALMGYGFSASWPAIFSFTEEYLGLTARICAFYTFLVGITCLITPMILTNGFKSHPFVLIHITGILTVISCLLFAIVRFWIWKNQTKLDSKTTEIVLSDINANNVKNC